MILQALLGLALGFVSSMPIGPINIRAALLRQERLGRRLALFLAGVVMADVAVALLALLGLVQAHLPPGLYRWIGLAGGVLLLAYAAWGLFVQRSVAPGRAPGAGRGLPDFVLGLLLCAGNPGFFLFWIYGSSELMALGNAGWAVSLLYLCGVAAGDLLWFALYLRGVDWLQPRVGRRLWSASSYALTGILGLYSIGSFLRGSV